MSIVSRLFAIAGVLCCSVASADLYTGHIASLEWKTHSADAVLLVSVQSTSADETSTKLIDVFARDGGEGTDARSIAESWEPPLRYTYQKGWKPDGEWLLFVRRWNDKEPTIDHAVYLENPLQASTMAAVSADGKVLDERREILAIIRERLASAKPMTERQRAARQFVDKGNHSLSQRERRGIPENVAPWLGGFQIPANIDIWDGPEDDRSFNESLWVTSLTVPADDAYRKVLFDYWINYVRMNHEERQRLTGGYPLSALVNYPGEQTEQLLQQLMAIQQHQFFDSKSVLHYLRFYESEFDEDDRQLVGNWVLTTSNERVQYDLMDNHELIAYRRPIPFPHHSNHQREWYAKGRWNLHDGRLRFLGTSLRVGSSNRFRQQSSPQQLLYHPRIVRISDDTITIDEGVVLKRVQKPIDIPE